MRAIYLQSVKSPLTSGGRFKLQYQSRQANHSEIFSQYTEPDDTRYMQDSFCVDSDHIEYAGTVQVILYSDKQNVDLF